MKIAYLMLVHSNPLLQKRAIEMLSADGCGFFIHVDVKSDIGQFSGIRGKNVSFVEPRIPVYWGEFSIVKATLHLMRLALESPQGYDYFVFMQGSDYPLRSGAHIQNRLTDYQGLEFLSLAKMPSPGFPLARLEAFRYPSSRPLLRLAACALGKIGLARRDHRRHLNGLEPYAGDASWTLSRNACNYIVNFAIQNPYVERFFENTFMAPDEWFFHTILGNSPFRLRCRRTLCYREYGPAMPHPADIAEKHLRIFESQERILIEDGNGSGEVLFARKFSDQTLHVVDRIDEMIRRKEIAEPARCRA